jgi:hypothetical protein
VRLSVCPVRCSVVPRISSAAAELSRGRRTLTSMPSDGHREFSYLNQISVPVEFGEHPMQAPDDVWEIGVHAPAIPEGEMWSEEPYLQALEAVTF